MLTIPSNLKELRDLGVKSVTFLDNDVQTVEFFPPATRSSLELSEEIKRLAVGQSVVPPSGDKSLNVKNAEAELASAIDNDVDEDEVKKLRAQLVRAEAEQLIYGSSD